MKSRKGFTLVELLIVVLILGALAAIAIPRITEGAKTAKINACKTNIDLINSQIEMYNANNGTWPTIDQITAATYFPDGAPECPFGTAYAIDATTHRINATTHNHN
jgi:type II secretion system protein G